MAAPLLLDILWPIFLALGLEHARIEPGATAVTPLDLYDYPYSHSLVMTIVWSALFAGVHYAIRRDRRAAWVLAAGVFSHFILDFVTHRPDMPLYPGGATRLGLGLWNSIAGTIAVEGSLWVGCVVLYATTTRSKDKIGSIAFWTYVALLSLAYAGDFMGPPPPSMEVLTIVSFVTWILIPWTWWFDHHREVVSRA